MNIGAPTTRPSSLLDLCRRNGTQTSTLLATLLACLVIFPLLGHKPLTNWDEGIYAEVSREMLSIGPLVPHWNYQPWFEKPPLMFWVTAVFFKLFGVHEFWARAGSASSGVAIVALLHGWLARRKDVLAAWLSTVILLSTFAFLHVCRVGEMDVLLSLGCCIALCGLSAVQSRSLGGWLLFWSGFAIALMTKGAASVTLLIATLILAAIERWNRTRLGRNFWLGLAGFLLIVLPWHLYMLYRFGTAFISQYLGLHVLARATHQIEDHVTHWWYYLWVLLVSAAPFALLYPFAIRNGLRRTQLRPWAIFAVVVLSFFTLVQTRLPHYIAPAYPALAILTAAFLADRLRALQQARKQPSTSFWAAFILIATSICIAAILLTGGARRHLHEAKVGTDVVYAEKESILLLSNVFSHPQPLSGPLLVWWDGSARSIATSVFYARRPVQQVQLQPLAPGTSTDKYLYQPQTLDQALSAGPRIILLDQSLIQSLPSRFTYTKLISGRTMAIGTIARR